MAVLAVVVFCVIPRAMSSSSGATPFRWIGLGLGFECFLRTGRGVPALRVSAIGLMLPVFKRRLRSALAKVYQCRKGCVQSKEVLSFPAER